MKLIYQAESFLCKQSQFILTYSGLLSFYRVLQTHFYHNQVARVIFTNKSAFSAQLNFLSYENINQKNLQRRLKIFFLTKYVKKNMICTYVIPERVKKSICGTKIPKNLIRQTYPKSLY